MYIIFENISFKGFEVTWIPLQWSKYVNCLINCHDIQNLKNNKILYPNQNLSIWYRFNNIIKWVIPIQFKPTFDCCHHLLIKTLVLSLCHPPPHLAYLVHDSACKHTVRWGWLLRPSPLISGTWRVLDIQTSISEPVYSWVIVTFRPFPTLPLLKNCFSRRPIKCAIVLLSTRWTHTGPIQDGN